jgi:hypothetical protein
MTIRKSTDWIAFAAAIISFCALVVSVITLVRDASDRRLSVQPIPDVSYFHRIEDFRLELRNRGLGPMLVKQVRFHHPDGGVTERLFPKSYFTDGSLARVFDPVFMVRIDTISAISVGEQIELARYEYKSKQTKNYAACLEELATGIEVHVTYEDVYGTTFSPFVYQIPEGNQVCE